MGVKNLDYLVHGLKLINAMCSLLVWADKKLISFHLSQLVSSLVVSQRRHLKSDNLICSFSGKSCYKIRSMIQVKPGHFSIKEYHFHVYWFVNNEEQALMAKEFRDKVIAEVASGNMVVVCNGVKSKILPGLNEAHVQRFNKTPVGPHPAASFEIWTPHEYLKEMLSFAILHRGDLTILVHPLGPNEIDDHTKHAMWLGPPFPLDLSVLDPKGGDPPQFPELGLGYSKK